MSMILELITLSDHNIERLLEQPERVWQVINPDSGPGSATSAGAETAPPAKRGFFQRLFGGKNVPVAALPPQGPRDLSFAPDELQRLDLDKAWGGLHFLLTGTAWEGEPPHSFLLDGDTVGDIDVGYGPARVHRSAALPSLPRRWPNYRMLTCVRASTLRKWRRSTPASGTAILPKTTPSAT